MPPTYRKYKTDADKVKVYEQRIRQGEDMNAKWHPAVTAFFARYETKHRDTQLSGNGHYISGSTPMVVGNIDSQYSSMTSANVDFTVTPKGRTTDDEAYVAQAALKEEFEAAKAQERGNLAIKDGLIAGFGFAKVAYEFWEAMAEVPRKREDIEAEIAEKLKEAADAGSDIDAFKVMDLVPLTEDQETVLSDRVVVDYVPWDRLITDPTAKTWWDQNWVAQKDYMRPSDVKNNPVYKEYCASRRQSKKLEELKADTTVDREVMGPHATPSSEDERVTVYTIYDFDTGNVCVWAKGTKFLLNETANPFALNPNPEDKNPFVPVILRKTSSRIRGVSEMEVLRDIATEKDLYHSRLATYLERFVPKILAEERAFTQAGKNALKSQEIGQVVELATGHTVDQVKELAQPDLKSELYQMPDILQKESEDATGLSELQRGLFPDRKRTATETAEVVSASATRASEKRIALEMFWTGIGNRILQLMQAYYERDRVLRLADDEVDVPWEYNAESISGSMALEVALTPKEAKTWQQRRDDALATLNVIGPLAQPDATGASPVDVTELLRYVLQEMNIPRRVIRQLLNLPEEQQKQVLGNIQNQAAQAQAQGGQVRSDLVPGPLSAPALAAAANTGTIPPELLAAAGSANPAGPTGAEELSESAGIVNQSIPQ